MDLIGLGKKSADVAPAKQTAKHNIVIITTGIYLKLRISVKKVDGTACILYLISMEYVNVHLQAQPP